MPDIKISQLPTATTVNDNDIVVINQGGTTKTAARSLIKNAGTVTSITAGTGLTGGTITSTGTIALTTTEVSPGLYGSSSQVAALTVDQYGRITTATSASISITTAQISGLSIPTVPTNIVKNNQSDTTPVNFIRALTQAEYDAISPKDPNTVYFIKS